MATVAKKNSWYYNSSKLEKNPWLSTGGEGWGTASWLLGPEVLLERVRSSGWLPGGGRSTQQILNGEVPPQGPPPYPFIYHFGQKRYLFRTPSIDKWYPFHIPSLELCIPFDC